MENRAKKCDNYVSRSGEESIHPASRLLHRKPVCVVRVLNFSCGGKVTSVPLSETFRTHPHWGHSTWGIADCVRLRTSKSSIPEPVHPILHSANPIGPQA